MQHVEIIWVFVCLGELGSVPGETEEIAGFWFCRGDSTQADTMVSLAFSIMMILNKCFGLDYNIDSNDLRHNKHFLTFYRLKCLCFLGTVIFLVSVNFDDKSKDYCGVQLS